MGNKRKVSIIIPVYNGADFLGEAIESCLQQTYSDYEIIVVNDGSDDAGKTREAAKRYAGKIRYFEKENGGVASALNYGVDHMEGDYFAWLSHDDLFCPDKLSDQVNAIESAGDERAIALSNYYFADKNLRGKQCTDFQKYYPVSLLANSVFLLLWGEFHFSGLLFHKRHFRRIGKFDTGLKTAQDNDFIFRLLRNQKLVFTENPVSIVRLHDLSGTSNLKETVNEENRRVYFEILQAMDDAECQSLTGDGDSVRIRIGGILYGLGDKKSADELRSGRTMGKKAVGLEKKIVIFGAGQYGMRLRYELEAHGISPFCFIDNSLEKNRRILDGLPCYLPQKLKEFDTYTVIIAQKYYRKAKEQLEEMGIRDYLLKDEIDAAMLREK